jgi:hypothetical protein
MKAGSHASAPSQDDNRVERVWGPLKREGKPGDAALPSSAHVTHRIDTGAVRHHHELLHMINGFSDKRGVVGWHAACSHCCSVNEHAREGCRWPPRVLPARPWRQAQPGTARGNQTPCATSPRLIALAHQALINYGLQFLRKRGCECNSPAGPVLSGS